MTGAKRELTPTPPFDFAKSLAFLATFRADGVAKEVGPGRLEVPLLVGGAPLLATLEPAGGVEEPALRARLASEAPLDAARLEAADERLRAFLGLDDDLAPFYALAREDPAFAPIAERLHGYHQVRFPSLFAALCWAVVTQRTPNAFAYRSMRAITEALGERLVVDGRRWQAFPAPQALLRPGSSAALLGATNNTRKVERLTALARAVLGADEAWLRQAPYQEAYRWLLGLPGIGPWSAEYVMLRGLGRHERTPWSDTWLLEGLSQLYTGGFAISRGDARRLAERYGWYQGYWVHYLKVALWH